MKTLLSLLILAIASTGSLFAQTTTTTVTLPSQGTHNVTLAAGQVLEMLMWVNPQNVSYILVETNYTLTALPIVIAGPRTFAIKAGNRPDCAFTYKITTDSQTATASVSSQAVVIPSTGISNADIIFESSTDLVSWTAAVAGNYLPTTPKRFFRVRLVTHN